MNDQWSGKTLRALRLTNAAEWNRSSISLATPPPIRSSAIRPSSFPEARADGLLVVVAGHEIPLTVHGERELGQRPRRRAEDHRTVLRHVERGLVARAEQVVGLLLVQADRT